MSKPRKHDIPEEILAKRERQKKISKDEIVKITRRPDYSTEDLIKALLKQAAEENMQLNLLREEETLEATEFMALTKRKAEILKQMGDLTLNLHRTLAANEINLRSEGFKIALDIIIGYFGEAMDNARLPDEHKSNVMEEFANLIDELDKDYKDELKAKGIK